MFNTRGIHNYIIDLRTENQNNFEGDRSFSNTDVYWTYGDN